MSINIQIICTHVDTKENWDIGSICEQIDITWSLYGNAGAMDIACLPDNNVNLSEGDIISLKVGGKNFFHGWIFKVDKSAFGSIKYRVYDVKRYLAYKDVDVTGNETIDQFFARICKMANIEYIVTNTSSYIIPSKIHDGETYNTMLEYAIDQTFIGTGERFCIRANGSKLELLECSKQLTDIVVGDRSLMTDYQFSSDIEETYTAFKIQREVPSEQQKKMSASAAIIGRKEEVHQTDKVNKWGVLQYYEKLDSKWTDSQMQAHLALLAATKSTQHRTLKIEAIGSTDCIPGNMITTLISDLEQDGVPQKKYTLITEAKHTITHNDHVMNLDLEIA